jgi:ribosomal protein S26
MPDTTGDDIIDSDVRESAPNSDNKSASGGQSRTIEPEIINGYEAESPRTERINDRGSDDGIKRTKSGKIDGRTKWGRGKSDATEGTQAKVRLESFSIEGLLIGIHQMGAAMLKTPELEITEKEAKQLSEAAQAVAREYNHVINPKTAAWIQLCVACGTVYGTRIVAIRMREKQTKKKPIAVTPNPEPQYVDPDPIERPASI